MTYAGHIGRVGALAVALGVGMAVATTPGIASAEPSDSGAASSPGNSSPANASSTTTESSTMTESSTTDGSTGEGAPAGVAAGAESPASVPGSVGESTDASSQTIGGDGGPVVVISSSGGAQTAGDDEADDVPPPADDDDDTVTAGDDDDAIVSEEAPAVPPAQGGGSAGAGESAYGEASAEPPNVDEPAVTESNPADDVEVAADDGLSAAGDAQRPGRASEADDSANYAAAATAAPDELAAASVSVTTPPAPAPTVWDIAGDVVETVVSVATQLMSTVVSLAVAPTTGGQSPLAWMMLAYARKEFENLLGIQPAADAGKQYYTVDANGQLTPLSATALAATAGQHVLLIGVDGTNLSNILADPYNQAFFDLMNGGTTGASTIVGHTTISNPSWTGVTTGVWSETAGVINNTFTPWTYDTWPTVFNQLEEFDPNIVTTVIADWEVIAKIAGAGSIPADHIDYIAEIDGSRLLTDDAVGAASVAAIQNTAAGTPSFQFTYFVGVDNTGHDTAGSGTPEYAAALRNVNDNIADIMAAVDAWETANPTEQWTVILVTDHGQSANPPLGTGLLAHGFQSPAETTVWVIANGPDFEAGAINNAFLNIDVTPTVVKLFGLTPAPYSEGMPLMDRQANNYKPSAPGQAALQQALHDAIAMYGYPDITTQVALGVRTIAAMIPTVILDEFTSLTAGLPVFVALPIQFVGAVLYQVTNLNAQIIARMTGVTGNSIIPPDWWPYTPIPDNVPNTVNLTEFALLDCDGSLASTCLAS